MADAKPVIYGASLSAQAVTVKTKITVTVVADDIPASDTQYARQSNYDLIAGQNIGVI